jgi:hypothetical protein
MVTVGDVRPGLGVGGRAPGSGLIRTAPRASNVLGPPLIIRPAVEIIRDRSMAVVSLARVSGRRILRRSRQRRSARRPMVGRGILRIRLPAGHREYFRHCKESWQRKFRLNCTLTRGNNCGRRGFAGWDPHLKRRCGKLNSRPPERASGAALLHSKIAAFVPLGEFHDPAAAAGDTG